MNEVAADFFTRYFAPDNPASTQQGIVAFERALGPRCLDWLARRMRQAEMSMSLPTRCTLAAVNAPKRVSLPANGSTKFSSARPASNDTAMTSSWRGAGLPPAPHQYPESLLRGE